MEVNNNFLSKQKDRLNDKELLFYYDENYVSNQKNIKLIGLIESTVVFEIQVAQNIPQKFFFLSF